MSRRIFDLTEVAETLGIERGSMPSMPGGHAPVTAPGMPERKFFNWKYDELPKLVEIAKQFAAGAGDIAFTGAASSWVLGAAAANMASAITSFIIPGREMPVPTLPQGEPTEAGEVKFTVSEKGGKTYIAYLCDDPSKPMNDGPHNYDMSKLPLVVLPELKQGARLYLTTNGMFVVLVAFLKAWTEKCDSISIYDPAGDCYICGYAKEESLIGKVEKK